MKTIKTFLILIILGTLFFIVNTYKNVISKFIIRNFIVDYSIVLDNPNSYYKENDFSYFESTDNFFPENKEELIKVFYTILNNGWNEFAFFCAEDYSECVNDIKQLTTTDKTLSNLNSFIHPFNNYKKLQIEINSFGKVFVNVEKIYNENDIKIINEKIDQIIALNITNDMNTKDKIKVFHDYIANNTKYDTAEANIITSNGNTEGLLSYKATNVLFSGLGLCGGYTDTMAIFLNKLGIVNYKISNYNHVWNYIKLDNWYHLDLTWDDPVITNGADTIIYDFFLITTKELEKIDTSQHLYDKNIYIEAN